MAGVRKERTFGDGVTGRGIRGVLERDGFVASQRDVTQVTQSPADLITGADHATEPSPIARAEAVAKQSKLRGSRSNSAQENVRARPLSKSVTIAADLKRTCEPAVTEDVHPGEMIGKL